MRNIVLNAPVIILIVSFRIFTLEEGQDYTEFEFLGTLQLSNNLLYSTKSSFQQESPPDLICS